MLLFTFFFTLFASVSTQEILGINYSFDKDFKETFDSSKCSDGTKWQLVEYAGLRISSPHEESLIAIRATNSSCTCSFPIMLFPGSVLEITVFVRTVSNKSGIAVVVFDEAKEVPIVSYLYGRSKDYYIPGWCTLTLPIEEHTVGYIKLLGSSLENELVLIDSLVYKPDITKIRAKIEATPFNNDTEEEDESIEDGEIDLEVYEGSGVECDEGGLGDNSCEPGITTVPTETVEPPIRDVEEESGFWNTFTITLVSVGAFTVVGVTAVSAYYIGVNRAMSRAPLIEDIEEVESPVTIPRIRSVYSPSPSDIFSRYT